MRGGHNDSEAPRLVLQIIDRKPARERSKRVRIILERFLGGVHRRADALIGEQLDEQGMRSLAVDDVAAEDSRTQGEAAALELGDNALVHDAGGEHLLHLAQAHVGD